MAKLLEFRASSVEQFSFVATKLARQWDTEPLSIWFRGHTDASWDLVSSFHRHESRNPEGEYREEDEMREEFATRAPILTDMQPSNEWDWYILMQHHGVTTRLLDWTEGGMIGLYFAVRHNEGRCDAAVWALDPWSLNSAVLRRDEIIPVGEPGVSAHDQRPIKRWLPARFGRRGLPKYPVAIYPTHFARRIGAQRSCFTIHGRVPHALHEVPSRKPYLAKITIPKDAVDSIRDELTIAGVDEATIYPDLDGLGRALNMKWLRLPPKPLPHVGVYTRLKPSPIHGVGVYAIARIRKGTRLFAGDESDMVWVPKHKITSPPIAIGRLYEDFAVFKDGRYGCPTNFNALTVAWYLNESKHPNVRCSDDYDFFAARDIRPGEELTVDYRSYSEALPKLRKRGSARRAKRRRPAGS